jgi:CMP-2-keto-3-deoxyoctulosonic acid synthetase
MDSGGYYLLAGIYAFRQDILDKFTSLKPSANEVKYKLEQLRAIDNGISIKVALTDRVNRGIDTLEVLNEMKK